MKLLQYELTALLTAYLFAGIPVAGMLFAGRMSSLYRLPSSYLCRWWSRFALIFIAVAFAYRASGG
jgi:hypothetical protein